MKDHIVYELNCAYENQGRLYRDWDRCVEDLRVRGLAWQKTSGVERRMRHLRKRLYAVGEVIAALLRLLAVADQKPTDPNRSRHGGITLSTET